MPGQARRHLYRGDVVEVSTRSRIVGDILAEAGITLDPQKRAGNPSVEAELDLPLIFIDRAVEVVIRADGCEWQAVTWARTVAELLQEQGLSVEGDLVDPPPVAEHQVRPRDNRYPGGAGTAGAGGAHPGPDCGKRQLPALGQGGCAQKARDGVKRVTHEIVHMTEKRCPGKRWQRKCLVPPVDGVILRGIRAAASRGVLSVQEGHRLLLRRPVPRAQDGQRRSL